MTAHGLAEAGSTPATGPVPHPYRWRVLAIGVLAQGGFAAAVQGLPSVGPALQLNWHLSLPELGALLTAVALGGASTMLLWGVVADRIGERIVLTLGLSGGALATTLAAFSASYPALLGWLIVSGACGGASSSATGRAVMRAFAVGQRGLALGIRQTAPTLGAAAGAAALPPLTAAYGIRTGLLALAAGMLFGAILSVAGLRGTAGPSGDGAAVSTRGVLVNRNLWRVMGVASCAVVAQTTLVVYTVAYLVHQCHWDLGSAAIVLAVCQILGAAARIASGRWSDRLQSRAVPMRHLTAATTFGLVALAAAMSGPPITVYVLGVIVFVFASSTWGLFVAAATEIAGAQRSGTATGLINTAMHAAGATVPIGIGMIISATGWQFGVLALAVLSGTGWLLASTLPSRESRGWVLTVPVHDSKTAR